MNVGYAMHSTPIYYINTTVLNEAIMFVESDIEIITLIRKKPLDSNFMKI